VNVCLQIAKTTGREAEMRTRIRIHPYVVPALAGRLAT